MEQAPLKEEPGALVADKKRSVRTYAVRSKRLAPSKARTMSRLRQVHGLDLDQDSCDWKEVFPKASLLHVEIGIGSGEAMVDFAEKNKDQAIVGIDVYPSGVSSALRKIEESGIANAKVVIGDALEIMPRIFGPGSLSGIRVFFPDPWPKKRHHKRRMVKGTFLDMVSELLFSGGTLHFATDWMDYADEVRDLVAGDSSFKIDSFGSGKEFRHDRAVTRYERRGIKEGRRPWDLLASRV